MKNEERNEKYLFIDACEITEYETHAQLRLPDFFPGSGLPLELTVTQDDEKIFFSDQGSAYRALSARTTDPYILKETIEYLTGVYLNIRPNERKELIWSVSSSCIRRFYRFFQCVALCAHADLYPGVDEEQLRFYGKYIECITFPLGKMCPKQFLEELKQSALQLENRICLDFCFSDEEEPMGILLDDYHSDRITMTDVGSYDGGNLVERLEDYHREGYRRYDALLVKVCERFGAEYDGERVWYSFRNKTEASLAHAVFRFMQLMSVLSELGITIRPGSLNEDM